MHRRDCHDLPGGLIQTKVHTRIAVFEHLRPEARNPLSMALRSDYADMVERVRTDGARVLVLAGGGGAFCGGADVKTMHARLSDGTQAAGVRERLETSKVPQCLKGFSGSLIMAGLMAVAFMGFSGLNV